MSEPIFDFHSHPLTPAYRRALALEAGGTAESATLHGVPLPPWSVEQHLEMMDQHGIGVCLLSVNSLAEVLVGSEGRAMARAINEEFAALVTQHPSRFGAFAAVPMDDMDAAVEETAYALDVLKLDGVSASTHRSGVYLGEPVYDPWFEEMHRRETTLFVHPVVPPGFDSEKSRINVSALEFMFDTTRMVTSMVLSGAKQRFDRINFIATHGGGTIPFLAQRISLISQMPWAYRGGPKLTMDEVRAALASFYYDLTAATSQTSLDALKQLVPAKQLLLGFDFPLMPEQTILPAIKSFTAYADFDESEKREVARGNALRLFPRFDDSKAGRGEPDDLDLDR